MALFRRFEFWVAILFLGIVLIWALLGSRCSGELGANVDSRAAEETKRKAEPLSESTGGRIETDGLDPVGPKNPQGVEENETGPMVVEAPTSVEAGVDSSVEAAGPLQLKQVRLGRDGEHALLEVFFFAVGEAREAIRSTVDSAQLIDGSGVVVPRFRLGTAPQAELDPDPEKPIALPFWISVDQWESGSLLLRVGHHELVLQTEEPFDLSSLEDGGQITLPAESSEL